MFGKQTLDATLKDGILSRDKGSGLHHMITDSQAACNLIDYIYIQANKKTLSWRMHTSSTWCRWSSWSLRVLTRVTVAEVDRQVFNKSHPLRWTWSTQITDTPHMPQAPGNLPKSSVFSTQFVIFPLPDVGVSMKPYIYCMPTNTTTHYPVPITPLQL